MIFIGLYSYIDDVGESHSVRYAAGANTGFEVLNAVPDAPSYVKYNAPLYKADRRTRGRVAYERGPGRQYKFITSGPDQRRSESTGPDGITRGSYSYLDDKGTQRTIQYIAGPGIGYRVVQSTTGPGTHLLPRPAVPEFGIRFPESNDIVDDEGSGFKPGGGGSRPFGNQNNRISTAGDNDDSDKRDRDNLLSNGIDVLQSGNSNGNTDDSDGDDGNLGSNFNRGGSSTGRPSGGGGVNFRPGGSGGLAGNGGSGDGSGGGSGGKDGGNRGSGGNSNDDGEEDYDGFSDNKRPYFNNNRNKNNNSNSNKFNRNKPNRNSSNTGGGGSGGSGYKGDEYDDSDDRKGSTSGPGSSSGDWRKRARESTITNVGSWYVGLPPGVAVRAHVQNIDLLPAGQGVESPGQALKREDHARLLKIY